MSKDIKHKLINKVIALILVLVLILLAAIAANNINQQNSGYNQETVKDLVVELHQELVYELFESIDIGNDRCYVEYTFTLPDGFEFSVITGEEPVIDDNQQWDGKTYRKFIQDGYIDGYLKLDEGQNKIKEIASNYSDVTLETDEYEDREVVVALSTENLDTYESLCNDMKEAFLSYWVDQSEALGDINYGINCNFMIIYESGELYKNKILSLNDIIAK